MVHLVTKVCAQLGPVLVECNDTCCEALNVDEVNGGDVHTCGGDVLIIMINVST